MSANVELNFNLTPAIYRKRPEVDYGSKVWLLRHINDVCQVALQGSHTVCRK